MLCEGIKRGRWVYDVIEHKRYERIKHYVIEINDDEIHSTQHRRMSSNDRLVLYK